jgi:hypothetical protein
MTLLFGRFVKRGAVLRHHCRSGFGRAATAMIDTRYVDRRYSEVERANAGQGSYKTAHGWPGLSEVFEATDGTRSLVVSPLDEYRQSLSHPVRSALGINIHVPRPQRDAKRCQCEKECDDRDVERSARDFYRRRGGVGDQRG